MHHFPDDTNLLLINKSPKQINKLTNHDLPLLVQWLRSNKISLNTSKTEILLFRPKAKTITKHFNFRISGERIKASTTVKYPGILLHEHPNWQKLGCHDFWRIANSSVLNKGKSPIPSLFNGPEVLSSASDKAKLFAESFSLKSNLDDSGISLPVFSSRTNLKLHNIYITSKMVRKVVMNLD